MRWCRIRLVLLGLLLCVVHVVSGTCGQTLTDPLSSALLSDIVIEGKVRKTLNPGPDGTFNISVSVRKKILKGEERINNGEKTKRITLGKFKDGGEDKDKCVGNVEAGRTYIFFLRDVGDSDGLYFQIMALPIKKTRRHLKRIKKIVCDKCAKSPSIKKLQGPTTVGASSKLTLKCSARAKPNPVFTWYKDGVLLQERKGVRIKNGKRGSKLQIKEVSSKDAGVYECVATNAVGVARKNTTIHVREVRVPCKTQTLCLNGGVCMHIPNLGISFCECPENWAGRRCELLDAISVRGDYQRQATLLYERTLIVIGIVIAVLVFVVICIASYFLAKRRRERFEKRRKRREAKREVQDNRHTDSVDRPDPHIRISTGPNYAAGQPGSVPFGNKNEFQPRPMSAHNQELRQQQQPLLRSELKPDALGNRPESRGRLAASSMYENCDNARPPSFTDCVDFHKNVVTTAAMHPENYEMTPLGERNSDGGHVDNGDTSPPYANINGENKGDNSVDVPHLPPPPPLSSDHPPTSKPPLSYHEVSENAPPPLSSTVTSLEPQPLSSSSSPSPPPLPPHQLSDDASSRGESDTAAQPLLPKHAKLSKHNSADHPRLFESKSDKNLSRHLPSGSKRQGASESPEYGHGSTENDHLLKNYPKVSHSNTFPRAKVNGTATDSSSESSDDDEEGPYEVRYEPADLHISETDLDLSKENLISDSFSSVVPSRQASREEPVLRLLQNSKLSRPEMRKYQSEEGPAYNILANKSAGYQLQDYARSHSLDDPPASSREEFGSNPRRLNSTLAGSPDVETYDNIPENSSQLHNHNYAYDPNDDSAPWDGEGNRKTEYSNLTEEDDKLNRLKDVVPDQQAIAI